MKVYEAIAECLRGEGVENVFGLMGDGNMDILVSLHERAGVRVLDARHEGAALAMSDGYARVSGDVGVCTVTQGPGLTHLATSLTFASRHGTPLVVLAGDVPSAMKGEHDQDLDQRRFAETAGALFHPLRAPGTVARDVQQAFWLARTRRMPVILNCPVDIQEANVGVAFDYDYEPSSARIGLTPRLTADPDALDLAAGLLAEARRPVIVVGRGAIEAGARDAVEALAAQVGAALASTLQAKGSVDGPWSIGVCGSMGTDRATPILAMADLVVLVGTSASVEVTGSGGLFPNARTLLINTDPTVTVGGRPADCLLVADARLAVEALLRLLADAGLSVTGYRSEAHREYFEVDGLDAELKESVWEVPEGRIDPRLLIGELDRLLPLESRIVMGIGHYWTHVAPFLSGRRSRQFTFAYDFGCIGQALPVGFGAAIADPDLPVIVFEGDGSILQNIQELDTIARYGSRILIVVMNDGGLGAESHKLRATGRDPGWAMLPSPDFARVAEAFGNTGATLRDPGQAERVIRNFVDGEGTHVVDVLLAPEIPSRYFRCAF